MMIMHRDDSTLLNHKGILYKLALVVLLVIGGGNSAWADTEIFNSTNQAVTSGWAYTRTYNNAETAASLSSGSNYCLVNYNTTSGPSWYTSTGTITISSGQKIVINAKKYGTSNSGSIKIYYSSDNGANYTQAKELTYADGDLTSTYNNFIIDNISGTYKIRFEFLYANISAITLVDADSTPVPTNITVSNIAYNSATLSWTAGGLETQWQVFYSTTEGEPDENVDKIMISNSSLDLTSLSPSTNYYAYVRAYIDAETQSNWVSTSFTTYEQFPIPTNFACTSVTGTTAIFGWNNGNGTTPTSWQLRYSTSSNFDPSNNEGTLVDNISTNPYTLNDLTDGTTYYASICAFYGEGNYSNWTDKVEFVPNSDIIINDNTNSSRQAPFHASYVAYDTKGQMVIPAAKINQIRNRQITKITYHSKATSAISWGAASFNVYVKESNISVYPSSSPTYQNHGTNVKSNASLSIDDNGKMEVIFDVPFNYTTGNLMISFELVNKGTNNGVEWYGLTNTYESYYVYNNGTSSYSGRNYFAPKMSITTVPATDAYVKIGATGYTTFSSSWPLDLSNLPEGLSAYYATASGIKDTYVSLTPATTSVAAGTGLILKGTPGQVYNIPVAESGTDLTGTNLMVGVCPLESNLSTNSNYYVLVKNSTTGKAEFQSLEENGATIPGGKAYLNATGAGARLSVVFDDESVTGIESMNKVQGVLNNEIYNLQGQRIFAPAKGIYIRDGKKVFVK